MWPNLKLLKATLTGLWEPALWLRYGRHRRHYRLHCPRLPVKRLPKRPYRSRGSHRDGDWLLCRRNDRAENGLPNGASLRSHCLSVLCGMQRARGRMAHASPYTYYRRGWDRRGLRSGARVHHRVGPRAMAWASGRHVPIRRCAGNTRWLHLKLSRSPGPSREI
jgi:hypothetical protein